jgi:hypothetical protein
VTKRLNGAGKPGQYPRDPYDWYKEPPEAVEALFDALDFGGDLIFDPSCGSGNILDVAKRRGHLTAGADVIDRHARHPFQRGNFLLSSRFPGPHDRALSIVNNPPYNYVDGIAEQFIHKALADVPFRLAAFLLPIEFACGQGRYERLYSKRPPAYVGFLMQRPSMPPGAMVEDLGDAAYRNGMADYVWLVWKDGGPYATQAIFMPPPKARKPESQRRIKRGSLAERLGITKRN